MAGVVCVLGMHRSGTSAVARVLDELGVCWGPRERLFGSRQDNPDGFWEHADLVGVNEEILARLGGSWHEPPTFPPGWERGSLLADLRARAASVLAENFSGAPLWGWKDPRACLTLPFWRVLLPPTRYIVCLRNPLSVAHSLHAREGFPLTKSARLWLWYLAAALRHIAREPRLLVSYEELVAAPERVAERLARFVGLAEAGPAPVLTACASVRRDLQHHRASLLDTVGDRAIPFPVRVLYAELHRAVARAQEGSSGADEEAMALAAMVEAADAEQAALDWVVADQQRALAAMTQLRARLVRLETDLAGHREHLARLLAHPVWRGYLGLRSALRPDGSRRAALWDRLRARPEGSRVEGSDGRASPK